VEHEAKDPEVKQPQAVVRWIDLVQVRMGSMGINKNTKVNSDLDAIRSRFYRPCSAGCFLAYKPAVADLL
jgi:hypothetical protein